MQVKFIKSILLLLLWSTKVTTESLNNTHPGLKGYNLEDDMVLTEEQKNWLRNPKLTSRNGLRDPRYRWPNGVLPFYVSPEFSATEIEAIYEAMDGIASGSCIRFEEAPEDATAYVHILPHDTGCFADVGFTGDVRIIGLRKDCITYGKIQHELMHSIGFHHQHNDPTRDDYIKINYENILEGGESSFEKLPPDVADDFGVGYDYDSVMHYPPLAFSSNDEPTIESLTPGVEFGLFAGMSEKDFLKLNRMYQCTIESQ